MKVVAIRLALAPEVDEAVDALLDELERRHGCDVRAVATLNDGDASDAFLLCGSDARSLEMTLSEVSPARSDRLRRTIVVGAEPEFTRGSPEPTPGTVAALLERYHLAGCLAPKALTAWSEAPSWFAGPKEHMADFQSNPLKAFQSDNYAFWFHAPGATLGEFLIRYVASRTGLK